MEDANRPRFFHGTSDAQFLCCYNIDSFFQNIVISPELCASVAVVSVHILKLLIGFVDRYLPVQKVGIEGDT